MLKQDLPIGTKYRATFDISIMKSFTGLKALITIQDHYMIFKVTDYSKLGNDCKDRKFDIFYNLLKPIYVEGEENILINYGIIKSVKNHENRLKLEIFNPSYLTTMGLILYNIESVGILMNKTLNSDGLTRLCNFFNTKIQVESKVLIEQFLLFFNMLRSEIDPNVIKYVHEDRFYRALFESKKYYEKSVLELKKQDKIKLSMNKRILSDAKWTGDNSIDMKRDLSGNMISETDVIERILNNNGSSLYWSFENIFNEVKTRANKIIDETIVIFLHISTLETNLINLKKVNSIKVSEKLKSITTQDNTNRHPNGREIIPTSKSRDVSPVTNSRMVKEEPTKGKSTNALFSVNADDIFAIMNKKDDFGDNFSSSTQTNSKGGGKTKEDLQPETPKFCPGQKKNEPLNPGTPDICITSLNEILKKIEEVKKNHSFLQPSSRENIIHNTIEIVHRKFFEIAFEDFFPKIFNFEKEKSNNLLKLDSLYSFFLNLRGLKNFLFTDENKLHFSNIFFFD
jgi:hypothetical protein